MINNTTLDSLQKFLNENVATKIKLQKPTDDPNEYTLVNPSVHKGWIPPKLPEGMQPQDLVPDIPCIIVGFDEGQDDGTTAEIKIRISFVTYGPGTTEKDGKLSINFNGYEDLLNLIDRTRMELGKSMVIRENTSIGWPVKWGMYQDQPYPYWYAWLTFSATCAVMEYLPLKEFEL